MKKFLLIPIVFTFILLGACSSEDDTKPAKDTNTSSKTIEENDIAKLYTTPKEFKGYNYNFVGQVFTTPEKDNKGVYLQVYADSKNYEYNTLVSYEDPNFKVADGDYVKVSGVIEDEFEGENMLGGVVTAPVMRATSLEVLSYEEAVAPAISSLNTGDTIDQNGFVVQVEKIEFAEPHTRLFVTVTNNTNDNISFYSHSIKLISNGTQYEEETDYDADFPDLQSDILPGITTSGVITFPSMDSSITELQVHAEGYSDNYDVDIKPFVFTITK
ncbi:hypothetical protein [Psychrobacillus sp. BL-248-WT-3]|uniref:hypothetical protein n=1 Tax=Psychrobacillus sp. BL-248-WT-3 TaxID=2725306 RepID=UPI00146E6C72|nr:hypothetical protein [Psychrobacillus sp. BL-248-WT-3]NME07360.1 hypothetical protein [Psychrobacillus sp. BL-248-WT-3]